MVRLLRTDWGSGGASEFIVQFDVNTGCYGDAGGSPVKGEPSGNALTCCPGDRWLPLLPDQSEHAQMQSRECSRGKLGRHRVQGSGRKARES